MPKCYHCGTPLGHIDDPCPRCLPNFDLSTQAVAEKAMEADYYRNMEIDHLKAENAALQAKLDRAVEGLRVYGDGANWAKPCELDIAAGAAYEYEACVWNSAYPNGYELAQSILREITEPQQGQTSEATLKSTN